MILGTDTKETACFHYFLRYAKIRAFAGFGMSVRLTSRRNFTQTE
ncbi:Uncharacterized protein dnm_015200 [Desulfonema magnum]|uniref:Uncharacterized protein n=1 Tax=Desulfonema magnum TaxID=45655 RepID=A0A975BHW0_9BACT|nr:Uncharacterized protein dnm_015200 [Desulfonema magnum]